MRVPLVVLVLLSLVAGCASTPPPTSTTTSTASTTPTASSMPPPTSSTPAASPTAPTPKPTALPSSTPTLPPLSSFLSTPSDRFLVNVSDISWGSPFLGHRALAPHAGAHVQFDNADHHWPRNGTAVEDYPAIYAVADGVIGRVETSYQVGANGRYGLSLAIAKDASTTWDFDYSIEPFVPEPSPHFYESYLFVKEGQHVKKGDVIARMYLPPIDGGPHIHFHLRPESGNGMTFAAPAIFTYDVVQAFHDAWGSGGQDHPDACMGWKLDAAEDPFGTGAIDCL